MACYWTKFKDRDGVEHMVHLNVSAPRRKRCAFCTCPDAKALCDYPVVRNGKAGTCDKPCCFRHRRHVGDNRDHCMDHWDLAEVPAQAPLFP
jgi:hypothetical protein